MKSLGSSLGILLTEAVDFSVSPIPISSFGNSNVARICSESLTLWTDSQLLTSSDRQAFGACRLALRSEGFPLDSHNSNRGSFGLADSYIELGEFQCGPHLLRVANTLD
jgi:hypothetical protein